MTDAETDGPPPETAEAIRQAVRRAFAKHGYADLSMAKIAEEFDGSQSLLHYHFDTKEGLIVFFLRKEREGYRETLAAFPAEPRARFEAVLSTLLEFEYIREHGLTGAYVELYGHATHSEAIRKELRAYDDMLYAAVHEAVADGVEAGVFRDVDPDLAAEAVFAFHQMAFQRAAMGRDRGRLREALERFVLAELDGGEPL